QELSQGHPLLGADIGGARGHAARIVVCRSQTAGVYLRFPRRDTPSIYFRPMEHVLVPGRFRAGPGLLGLLHASLLRRSIPKIPAPPPDTDRLDLPPARETVGMPAQAISTSTSVSGLVASCAGGLAMEADSSTPYQSSIATGVPRRFSDEVFDGRQP